MKPHHTLLLFGGIYLATMLALGIYHRSLPQEPEAMQPTQPEAKIVYATEQRDTLQLTGTVYPPYRHQVKKYVKLASGILVRNDTNIGHYRYCAISPDLFEYFQYGDTLHVITGHPQLHGKWIVHDCMADSMRRRIDFLIARRDIRHFRLGVYPCRVTAGHIDIAGKFK
jgi:hypothetical protein